MFKRGDLVKFVGWDIDDERRMVGMVSAQAGDALTEVVWRESDATKTLELVKSTELEKISG
jgi:hypothetical protein